MCNKNTDLIKMYVIQIHIYKEIERDREIKEATKIVAIKILC